MKKIIKNHIFHWKSLPVLAGVGIFMLLAQAPSTITNTFIASGTVMFGPETIVRGTQSPTRFTRTFVVQNSAGTFSLLLDNGENGENLVSSAIVRLNGKEIVGVRDFNQKVFNLS